jgi:aryl-alcohol dehydrogenase-like predicted oxidoreductase
VSGVESSDNLGELGATGLPISPIGLGLAALGRPGYINLGRGTDLGNLRSVEALEARAFEVLDAAWLGGVRYFDAARSYGRAEAFLGRWLDRRGIPRADAVVGSKWGYRYTADWRVDAETHEVKEHSLPLLRRQWLETRERLGDRLALYQVHSLTPESGLFEDGPLLADLAHLKRGGVRVGFTTSGPRQAAAVWRAIELEVEGGRLFDSVQATWNLLERSVAPALAAAHAAGMGVIVKEALANGRLTARNTQADFAPRRARLEEQAGLLGATVDALALAAALAQPWADVVLSGAVTPEQVRSNLQAGQVPWDDEAAERLAGLSEAPDEYWTRRAALPWN